MKISSRFSVAIHILSLLHLEKDKKPTSEYIAASVNTNPVVIRRISGMLYKAGIIHIGRGSLGTFLVQKADEITLLDVFRAVDNVSESSLFRIHENSNSDCPVGAHIQEVLEEIIANAQSAMEEALKGYTLTDVNAELMRKIEGSLHKKEKKYL